MRLQSQVLMVSSLVAGVIAGVAPAVPTFVKSLLAPGLVGPPMPSGQWSGSVLQIIVPQSTQPLILHRDGSMYSGWIQVRNLTGQMRWVIVDAFVQASNGSNLPAQVELSGVVEQP